MKNKSLEDNIASKVKELLSKEQKRNSQCNYCGSLVTENQNTCPNCGAHINK
ncbi:MAG: zinc ribbon domain-containing protein [Christensenellales bacterium]